MKKWFLYSPVYDSIFFFLPFVITIIFALLVSSFFPEIAQSWLSPVWFLVFIIVFDVWHVWWTLYRAYFHKKNFSSHKKLLLIVPGVSFLTLGFLWIISLLSWREIYLYPVYFLAWMAVFHFIKQQVGFVLLYGKKEWWEHNYLVRRSDQVITWMVTLIPMMYWWTHYDIISFEWFEPWEFQILADIIPQIPFLWLIYFLGILIYILSQILFSMHWHRVNPLKYLYILGTAVVWYLWIVHYNSALLFGFGNILVHGMNYYGIIIGSSLVEKENYWRIFQKIIFKMIYLLVPCSLILFAFLEEFFWNQFVWREDTRIFWDFFYGITLSEIVTLCIIAILGSIQLTHYILDRYIWRQSFGKVNR